jgi:hypothetical protein
MAITNWANESPESDLPLLGKPYLVITFPPFSWQDDLLFDPEVD